jgi:hypothetical protein
VKIRGVYVGVVTVVFVDGGVVLLGLLLWLCALLVFLTLRFTQVFFISRAMKTIWNYIIPNRLQL